MYITYVCVAMLSMHGKVKILKHHADLAIFFYFLSPRITIFGTSAKWLAVMEDRGLKPGTCNQCMMMMMMMMMIIMDDGGGGGDNDDDGGHEDKIVIFIVS